MSQIQIACDVKDSLPLDQLKPFQGGLKILSKENYAKLRKEIVETGFAFPVYVWMSPDGSSYILGGHQRVSVLKELRDSEGFDVPLVPIVSVHADSYEQAKRRILQDVSQYGDIDRQGLYEFMGEAAIGPGDLAESFDLPDLDLVSFNSEFFFDDVQPGFDSDAPSGAKELSQESFQKFDHKCPRCGFEFDAQSSK